MDTCEKQQVTAAACWRIVWKMDGIFTIVYSICFFAVFFCPGIIHRISLSSWFQLRISSISSPSSRFGFSFFRPNHTSLTGITSRHGGHQCNLILILYHHITDKLVAELRVANILKMKTRICRRHRIQITCTRFRRFENRSDIVNVARSQQTSPNLCFVEKKILSVWPFRYFYQSIDSGISEYYFACVLRTIRYSFSFFPFVSVCCLVSLCASVFCSLALESISFDRHKRRVFHSHSKQF